MSTINLFVEQKLILEELLEEAQALSAQLQAELDTFCDVVFKSAWETIKYLPGVFYLTTRVEPMNATLYSFDPSPHRDDPIRIAMAAKDKPLVISEEIETLLRCALRTQHRYSVQLERVDVQTRYMSNIQGWLMQEGFLDSLYTTYKGREYLIEWTPALFKLTPLAP